MILASGRTVFGIDQSQGMLARAHEKFPEVPIEKVGLQEMRYREAFDGAVCMDALEMVCPESSAQWFDAARFFVREEQTLERSAALRQHLQGGTGHRTIQPLLAK